MGEGRQQSIDAKTYLVDAVMTAAAHQGSFEWDKPYGICDTCTVGLARPLLEEVEGLDKVIEYCDNQCGGTEEAFERVLSLPLDQGRSDLTYWLCSIDRVCNDARWDRIRAERRKSGGLPPRGGMHGRNVSEY